MKYSVGGEKGEIVSPFQDLCQVFKSISPQKKSIRRGLRGREKTVCYTCTHEPKVKDTGPKKEIRRTVGLIAGSTILADLHHQFELNSKENGWFSNFPDDRKQYSSGVASCINASLRISCLQFLNV